MTSLLKTIDDSDHCDPPLLARRGYVRVPDGRIGTVIGFYKRVEESVVVKFASGDSAEFPTGEVEIM
jgi:hypothetical protein